MFRRLQREIDTHLVCMTLPGLRKTFQKILSTIWLARREGTPALVSMHENTKPVDIRISTHTQASSFLRDGIHQWWKRPDLLYIEVGDQETPHNNGKRYLLPEISEGEEQQKQAV